MSGFVAGYLLSLSLIVAIGAQNAFVLKQGLRRQHVFVVCLLCGASDAVLILAGVYGFAVLAAWLPAVEPIARWGGALFLLAYGARSFWAALRSDAALEARGADGLSLRTAVLTCLAFTWLNPHVYLDTFVLLGSLSTQYAEQRIQFALGATLASFTFFFALGYGARMLAPLFRRPAAWKVLEVVIGCVMWAIAYGLVRLPPAAVA